MFIHRRRGWEISESQVTPEPLTFGRRDALLGGAGLAAGGIIGRAAAQEVGPTPRNTRYPPPADVTAEREVTNYNNYYEFGTDKTIARAASRLPTKPWTIKVDGMVERPREFALEDLLRMVTLEERVYRLRCVEAWSFVVPWIGFPSSALLALVGPKPGAKFVRFETAALPSVMPGLRQTWYPWPYVEGSTVEEAANELSFLVVGAYGKPLLPQNGAPIRLHQPWKYGFKAGKSLVRITLTDQRPKSYWEAIQPAEYGFWANVNPAVSHPRWSQASERVVGTGDRIPTRMFNGYGEFVAGLYTNLQNERLYA